MPVAPDVCSNMKGRCGSHVEIDMTKLKQIPKRRRTNVRSLAQALNLTKSTVHRQIKEGLIKRHTNTLKPYLTDANKNIRLQFCLSMLEPGTSLDENVKFKDMYNCVHIDEKWFFISKESERYYLHPEEIEPLRTCQSKRFIGKVMFLVAVARPRFDIDGNVLFSGKIGIFPFVVKEPAKRSSKNQQIGTIETKPIAVNKIVYTKWLTKKVLLVIRVKWPLSFGVENVIIQHDNATPHIDATNPQCATCARQEGFAFDLIFQPPNSPDMNVLDLGYFRAIQSLQYQEAPNTIDELIGAVKKSFYAMSATALDNVFISLQGCMIETIKLLGGNNYKVPHFGKDRLRRNGNITCQLPCDRMLVNNALLHL